MLSNVARRIESPLRSYCARAHAAGEKPFHSPTARRSTELISLVIQCINIYKMPVRLRICLQKGLSQLRMRYSRVRHPGGQYRLQHGVSHYWRGLGWVHNFDVRLSEICRSLGTIERLSRIEPT